VNAGEIAKRVLEQPTSRKVAGTGSSRHTVPVGCPNCRTLARAYQEAEKAARLVFEAIDQVMAGAQELDEAGDTLNPAWVSRELDPAWSALRAFLAEQEKG
jgi:hypothetical protein